MASFDRRYEKLPRNPEDQFASRSRVASMQKGVSKLQVATTERVMSNSTRIPSLDKALAD